MALIRPTRDTSAAHARVLVTMDPVPVSSATRWPLPLRALVLDVVALVLVVGAVVTPMVRAGQLKGGPQTAAQVAALIGGWLLLIMFYGGYDSRFVGVGTDELKRVLSASVALLAVISALTYVLLPTSPPVRLVLPSIAIGTVALLIERWLLRVWLGRQRVAGRFQKTTLVVGDLTRSSVLATALQEDAPAGYEVVALVEPPPMDCPDDEVVEWLDDVDAWIERHKVGAVAIGDPGSLHPDLLRRLAWRLEGPRVDLLVSPMLPDVAGPRVSVRPASGLPLLHLDEPHLTTPKRFAKRAMDLALAIPALIVLSPLMLLIALAIKLDSPGPILYVSSRVGQGGRIFACIKFRSMSDGADALRAEVIGAPDDDVVQRYREDPRVTAVGRRLRRWSLDELPQLFNVINGTMSLVGPRPVLPEELDLLTDIDHRRHLTVPGVTGLWQVSGRKEVSWDDRMRLDLHYIENWSIALDVVIIAKTTKAVLVGRGAY